MKRIMIALLLSVSLNIQAQDQSANLAPTPPMGWNSYNSWGAAVTETEMRQNADYLAKELKSYGWQYVVVDYCWSYPHPPGSTQNNPPQFRLKKDNAPVPWLGMDQYGRLLPDLRKFPSAQNGTGFKALADYVHSLGLKFGIHVMRGIPRQAVWAKSPILGTNYTADQIADTTSICPWLNQMWGVDMNKPGAQEYYNSIAQLYESWGVDFIKMDDTDLNSTYPYRKSEVEAMHKALQTIKRPIVLSLSLAMKYENRNHAAQNSEMWRVSQDFWDEWPQLKAQFSNCALWAAESGPGNWPDADMLQLGKISLRGPEGPPRYAHFTDEESKTHMTLWSIFRSPLMMGGNLTDNTPYILSLLTNEEVIAVNQNATNSRQLYRKDDLVVWVSKVKNSNGYNVAFFNLNDVAKTVTINLSDIGLKGMVTVRDLWKKQNIGTVKKIYAAEVPPHGSKLFKMSPE